MNRIDANPAVLRWARERAGLGCDDLQDRFPKLADWEAGLARPTFRQLENFAKVTRTPFGFLFLSEPPQMRLPLADFRTIRNRRPRAVSPELIDTIYLMQRRQAWLRQERIDGEVEPLDFVGAARLTDDPAATGQRMRYKLGFTDVWANQVPSWQAAVGALRARIENIGVMAVINGIVGNNTRRKLDEREFRGFALSDPYAPLIFVNGADAKSAQMFTLAHEFAHLWLGDAGEGLSGFDRLQPGDGAVERFCDQAAAEFLAPAAEIRRMGCEVGDSDVVFDKLARRFKVSPIVIGRRMLDLGLIERTRFFVLYERYTQDERRKTHTKTGGGDFYNTQGNRVGKLFASYVITAAKEGRIGFKQAHDLCGLHGGAFQTYARKLGFRMP